ncbi:hypothetical protein N4T20_17110 [Flavobacterium sp. TR2]|uniref:hypothetical protein n=1 Tax=Flavobacterium sp. TR2 TaxID=2977321 RepID=UPI0021B0A461|nr:hypothetical protein [Flavobacterium sp. TR2]UWY27438.1 hypothetical protein N4T20_17110 [Flavobacterium sp. TR2]
MTNYLKSFRKEKLLLYLLLYSLFYSYRSAAQNIYEEPSAQFFKTISFGEKIDFGSIDESVTWTVSSSKNNVFVTLRGNEIKNYIFQEPGEYEINFHETKKHDGECDHQQFPEKFKIKVESVKISFDFSKISFSEKIVKGKNYSDLILTVPVKIAVKGSSVAKLPTPEMSIVGVGVSMTAEPLDKEIALNGKNQLLKYRISGTADKDTYLMFDFYDFSRQVQTYSLPQIIK